MKVTNSKIGAPLAGKADAAKLTKAENAQSAKADAMSLKGQSAADLKSGSKVDVSERAQMMQKAKAIATQSPDIDEAKVARLQKMIDEGSYKVDADKIADRLVEEHMTIPD